MSKLRIFSFVFFLLPLFLFSQTADWKFRYEYDATKQNVVHVYMDIAIPKGFHMYSFDQKPGGPIAAEVNFVVPKGVKKIGGMQSITKVHDYYDDIFQIQVRDFSGKVTWKQSFEVGVSKAFAIEGSYSYQLCLDDGMCVNPFPEKFKVSIAKPSIAVEEAKDTSTEVEVAASPIVQKDSLANTEVVAKSVVEEPKKETSDISYWYLLIAGFVGGLLAFLTPCVFPMAPLTVSIFMKTNKQHAKRDVSIFGLSIVVVYVALGLLLTLSLGADTLYAMSTSPIFNLIFFVLLIVFAISFFGVFNIQLPTSWVNYIDKKASSSSGLLSVFFMAFTLVLVSFSCTAMIIGTLLVEAVNTGSFLGPFFGMLGFSLGLALPFVILALLPSVMKSMPKSGSWMDMVKVILGFIELGFALKFLSNADLVAGWGILPRSVFLGIWIVLMFALGLYLLKKLPFLQKKDGKPLSDFRLGSGIAVIIASIYLVSGFFGNRLESLSGYLPPMESENIHKTRKYADIFKSPHGIESFYDFEEGMAYAKKVKKPVFLDFTGKACANCRKIEMNVWSDPRVLKLLKEEYVVISLYVDARNEVEKERQRTEEYAGKTFTIKTIGEHWSLFMMKNYNTLSQPYYVLLSKKKQLAAPIDYREAQYVDKFIAYLEKGLEEYKK